MERVVSEFENRTNEAWFDQALVALSFGESGMIPVDSHDVPHKENVVWMRENEFDFERYGIQSEIDERLITYYTLLDFASRIVEESIEPELEITRIVNKRFWDLF